jgi:hypothetical protein
LLYPTELRDRQTVYTTDDVKKPLRVVRRSLGQFTRSSFASRLAQGFVYPVLPARPAGLKMLQHVLVYSKRHLFPYARDCGAGDRSLRPFGGHGFEGRLGSAAGIP